MAKKNTVLIWKDTEAASVAAAHFFVTECQRCIAEKGKFIVALSGGNTPKRLFQLLASSEFSRNINWKKIFIFWSDERFVPHTDADSNYKMAKENLLDHIAIPAKNIFATPINKTAKESAAKYEATLRKFFKKDKIVFDHLMLGIGDDGHTASLFPGTTILQEKRKLISEVWVEQKQTWRISFTLPLINRASQIIFLVTGKEKATVVADVLKHKKIKPALPSQLVKSEKGIVSWVLDEDAASGL